MADPPPELAPGTTFGQYIIHRRIGAGGMGEVYDATHTGLNKRVAIKTLRREHAENQNVVGRFLREGKVASKLRHPHVVDVTDVGMIDGIPCLVMEFLDGETLGDSFKRSAPLATEELVDLLLPVMAAVHAAHELGIVHRDLKPANILLARTWSGEVSAKVVDFGISKLTAEPTEATQAGSNSFLGSPHYASPEMARGISTDARADQYALGVILYEGVTGRRPFAGKAQSFMALMYAIAHGEYDYPTDLRPDLPVELENVILRAMALSPDERFASVKDLGGALLPFASPRGRLLWEPAFAGASGAAPPSKQPAPPVPVSRASVPSIRDVQLSSPTPFVGDGAALLEPAVPSVRAQAPPPAAPAPDARSRLTLGEVARIAGTWLIAFGVGVALSWGALYVVARSKGVDTDKYVKPERGIESVPAPGASQ